MVLLICISKVLLSFQSVYCLYFEITAHVKTQDLSLYIVKASAHYFKVPFYYVPIF